VPIEEELYCDFYIPLGKKVYIEFWGKTDDEQYDKRMIKKIEIYKKHQLNLIELGDADILNLDDILPGKLLKYEIKGYM
jgi:S-adenosylmethionine/arginine decarboxylase-like enzyme